MTTNSRYSKMAVSGIAIAAATVLVTTPAMAQLDEITVTAQKKAEDIQDVPISLVAADADRLRTAGVVNLTDISAISSGVFVTDSNAYVFPIIRGLGSFIQGSSTNSSVGVFLDGVYIPRMTSTAFELGNVSSIEILKGPQVTLYGRNSTGGAVNIITNTAMPGDELSGKLAVTYGEYDHKRVEGTVSSGLGEMFGIDLTGYWVNRDGYIENLASFNLDAQEGATGRSAKGEGLDSLREFGGQIKLTFAPSENLRFTLAALASKYNDTASAGGRQLNPVFADFVLNTPGIQGTIGPTGPYTFATEYGTTYGHSNRRRGDNLNISLTGVYDTDYLTVTSITSYYQGDLHTSVDLLSANVPTLGFDGVQPTKNFQQELRFQSNSDSRFNWMAGANYFNEESDPDVLLRNVISGFDFTGQRSTNSDEALAGYGEVYLGLTDRLTLTGGVRYTTETVTATSVFDIFGFVAPGTTFSVKDDAVTYRVVADYKTDWGLLYASVSTGFKSGGINATNLASPAFEPEKVRSYEVGVKSTVLNNRLRLNVAGFLYDFTDIQAGVVGGPTGGAQYFINGDSADLSGIEADFEAALADGFNVYGGITYLFDREYTDFSVPGDPFVMIPPLDVTGNRLVGAAEFSGVIGANYEHSLGDAGTLRFSANLNHHSGYFLNIDNTLGTGGLGAADSVTLLNGRIDYTLPNGKIDISFWARNITDEKYTRAGIAALGGATVLSVDGKPQEFGGTITLRF